MGGTSCSENITSTGSGDASACSQVLQELSNFTTSARATIPAEGNFIVSYCTYIHTYIRAYTHMHEQHTAVIVLTISKAFSSFYHTADFFNTTQLNKRTFDNFTDVVKSFCNYTVKEVSHWLLHVDSVYVCRLYAWSIIKLLCSSSGQVTV